jgi:hypothetical protein
VKARACAERRDDLTAFVDDFSYQVDGEHYIDSRWSFAGDRDRQDVRQLVIRPFVNYNMADGWYLVSSPIMTANGEAASDET